MIQMCMEEPKYGVVTRKMTHCCLCDDESNMKKSWRLFIRKIGKSVLCNNSFCSIHLCSTLCFVDDGLSLVVHYQVSWVFINSLRRMFRFLFDWSIFVDFYYFTTDTKKTTKNSSSSILHKIQILAEVESSVRTNVKHSKKLCAQIHIGKMLCNWNKKVREDKFNWI